MVKSDVCLGRITLRNGSRFAKITKKTCQISRFLREQILSCGQGFSDLGLHTPSNTNWVLPLPTRGCLVSSFEFVNPCAKCYETFPQGECKFQMEHLRRCLHFTSLHPLWQTWPKEGDYKYFILTRVPWALILTYP